jgi:hypothetical protein
MKSEAPHKLSRNAPSSDSMCLIERALREHSGSAGRPERLDGAAPEPLLELTRHTDV